MNSMSEYLQAERAQEWRETLRKSMKNKDRTNLERVKMPEVDPEVRSHTYDEVNLGLTVELAIGESHRCLDCGSHLHHRMPRRINIPKFIKNIERATIWKRPAHSRRAVPSRQSADVCPQERQCESQCFYTLKLKKEPVAIGHLERFAADYERMSGQLSVPVTAPSNGIKIAVVGSGPAGLAFAGDMVKYGYDVTVFEALHELGGVLRYGIPEFRLPNDIVDIEIEGLRKMGVKFETNCIIGKTISQEDLREEGYKAIFVGSGADCPTS